MQNNRILVLSLALLSGLIISSSAQAQSPEELSRVYSPKLEKILTENIADFWYRKSLDQKNGGYIINFGPNGEDRGPGTKMIVTQSRQVWLFSRMARAGYKKKEYLQAAELGFRFLRDKMWDKKNGGFYWEVDATGEKQIRPKKHLYGQSFALYALSEYYLASQRKDVLDLAIRLFNLLEAKSHDNKYGGYREFFNEDWTTPANNEQNYMGGEVNFKLMNTHLHLLEAMTTYYRASKLPIAKDRLIELIGIESNAVIRKQLGACTDKYNRDWTPRLEGDFARVSYGHDLENIWLLIDACKAAGINEYPYLDLYRTLFDYSLKYGFDNEKGGFFYYGEFNKPAMNLEKSWWVQSEAMVSALYMYRLTEDKKYLEVFTKTFEFVDKYQIDWQNGEWHDTVLPDGKTRGLKGQVWKAGYHNGRSMIECLAILKQARPQKADSK